MSERRLYLDVCPGETRGIVTLDGRPERLILARAGEPPAQFLGAVVVGRVRAVEAAAGLAFVDLGEGPDGVLNLTAETGRPVQGAAVEVEIRAEARRGKGAALRWIGPSEGPPRVLRAAPSLEARLAEIAPGCEVRTGAAAREAGDAAQAQALASAAALSGGGRIWIEPTRALTAVDVDLGAASGAAPKRAARAANLAALGEAARALRLKGLGGLVVVDLVGRGHDAPAILAAARAAFAPDNPGVAFGPISRFGTLELTIPRRARPCLDLLVDESGRPTAQTLALDLLRALEREARADPGGRFAGVAAEPVIEAARAGLPDLWAKVGTRISLRAERGRAPEDFGVARSPDRPPDRR